MATNARALITSAFEEIGTYSVGEAPSAADMQVGFRRLNMLVSSWITQNLTSIALIRTVVPIVADQQYYTVGIGGQINIPRPLEIANVGLLLNGWGSPVSVTSITRSGSAATATVTNHGLTTGNSVYILGATQPEYNGLVTVTVTGVSTFTYTIAGVPATPATGTITMRTQATNAVEITDRVQLTNGAFAGLNIKNQDNSLFTAVWYTPTEPYGTLFLWPNPSTDENQLVLYTRSQFTGFADLFTEYAWATLPGYEEALLYNLALRLVNPFARPPNYGDLRRWAGEALRLIKRANATSQLTDLLIDPAITNDHRSGYNINTDTGG